MRYGDYLALDAILDAQHPRSSDPNELLFIVQHQTSELWMKLALHELRTARAAIAASDLPPAFKMLARVSRILEQLVHAWDVLATMTPSEYSAIRPHLGTSSGFQSWQYREIEFLLGNKNGAMLRPHDDRPDLSARLDAGLRRAVALRRSDPPAGAARLRIDAAVLARDLTERHACDPRSKRPGSRSIARRASTGTCTSSPRNWSTSRTPSGSGASAMSRPSNASSDSSRAPAAPVVSPTCAACSTSCCFRSYGRSGPILGAS